MKKFSAPVIGCLLLFGFGCANSDKTVDGGKDGGPADAPAPTPSLTYSTGAQLPHDTAAFTEGLEFYNGKLIESTGMNGQSRLVLYDPATGKTERELKLEDRFFGEGVTVLRDTAYQLTWRESTVFVYDARTFQKIKELPLNGEGWGLTHDGSALIATNGSSNLYYYEPGTFRLLKKVEITEGGSPAVNLNEVEYVNGFVYANQWQYPYILKIDPARGEVVAKMDLTPLVQQEKAQNPKADVLNGLAYDPVAKKFYVTGKYWSKIYELTFAF